MGTNFYLIHPIPQEKKEELKKFIDSTDDIEDITNAVDDILDTQKNYETEDTRYKIHIGKRSMGWQFLFSRTLEDYCALTRNGITEWLKTGQIVDEYGEKYSSEDFWKEVEACKDGMTSYDYEKKHPDEHTRAGYGDYINDGLRFTGYKTYFC